MLNYKCMEYKEYPKIIDKAKAYLQTAVAKSIQSSILNKTSIRMNDLICIIMYCDYSELSRDFTLSFRKSHQFELLPQAKKRNAVYYHWSKGLRDVLKHYGQHCNSQGNNGLLSKLRGPFYCGMSIVLKIPQARMFIQSPISTSLQIAVAVKFSGMCS